MSTTTTTIGRWRAASRLAISAAAFSLLLTGCTPPSDDAADGKTTVTAWVSRTWSNSADNFAAFMQEHPDIIVETEVIDTDDILERLLRAADAGQPLPDIIQDDTFVLEAFNDAGLVIPLDDYVAEFEAEDPDEFAKVLPIVWEEPTIDGQILGVANAANMDVLYYNVPWFEEAGVALPIETYEDLYDAAVALKATRPDSIPFSIQAVAGDGVTGLKTGMIGVGTPFDGATPDLQSSGAQYIIDFYQRMYEAGALPSEAIAWGEAEARGAFISGAGMIVDGFTAAGDYLSVDGFDFGDDWAQTLNPIQSGTGDDGARPSSSRSWSITTGSANPDAAWEVLKYTTSTDFLVPQVLQGGVPPRNSEAISDPAVAEYWPFFSEEVKEGYLSSVSGPSALNAGDVETILEQLWGEIVTGVDITPQELADKYQPQLDALNS
ncbi:MAG: extracellular solute-binding protein [Rhodoglobus sp.]|nr:extracellular solute-binding protein [Rhodoglobus sp.]